MFYIIGGIAQTVALICLSRCLIESWLVSIFTLFVTLAVWHKKRAWRIMLSLCKSWLRIPQKSRMGSTLWMCFRALDKKENLIIWDIISIFLLWNICCRYSMMRGFRCEPVPYYFLGEIRNHIHSIFSWSGALEFDFPC